MFASIKIITIVALLFLAVVLFFGGGPSHDRLGFRYWKNPGAMREYLVLGNTGRFLGFMKSFVNAYVSGNSRVSDCLFNADVMIQLLRVRRVGGHLCGCQ